MQLSVELAPGAENAPLADMLATMVRQNLDDRPEKRGPFSRMQGRVAIIVDDLGQAITLRFQRGRLTIFGDVVGLPDVTVRTDYESVMKMSLVEIDPRTGLPDPRGENAKDVFERSNDGTIDVKGMAFNVPLLVRLTNVMSVM